MKMYRCRICGETYLGSEAPSHCPFCGAHRESMIAPEEYPAGINDVHLTESERADLEAAVELERSNTRFYLGMAERRDNDTLRSTYKRLARVEAEHCSLFCKLLKIDKPADIAIPGETTGTWEGDIAESLRRETKASALYAEFMARTTSARLAEVFGAVSIVETDHIALDGVAKGYV
ncbi:MAG: ferritin [Coriobacteriaceae bacterium]|nr:ferritin [Coriobacteriaceae bacterium]